MAHVLRIWTAAVGLSVLATVSLAGDGRLGYPQARRGNHVDVYHGVKVADPYRWLEQDVRTSKEVADWVAAENRITATYFETIPEREPICRRMTELWDTPSYSSPMKEGGRYYYSKNNGLQNQAVLYVSDTCDGQGRVLLDPNQWSKDGAVALQGLGFSDDGKYVAYNRAEAGSDWSTWHVLEIATGRVLSDVLKWTKLSTASWTKDGKGFFYCRYEQPTPGLEYQAANYNNKLCYHRVGTSQADDVLVYWQPAHKDWHYEGATVTEDGRYLVIPISIGSDNHNRVVVKDLAEPDAMPIDLIDAFDHEYSFIGNDGPVLFFRTNHDAPRRRVIAIDLRKPNRIDWKEIIPQAADTLTHVGLISNQWVTCYLKDVRPLVKIYSLEGRFVRDLPLSGIGCVGISSGKRADKEMFYTFFSIATPPSIYRYDMRSGQSRLIRRVKAKFNPDDYEVKQVFYTSKDGTRVPMFIAHKKGPTLDGSLPTLLYGYGGFDVSLLPVFSVARLAWMEMGGVFAMPNLRGGGEYGEAWHKAGTKLQKQNVFDDFVAAAQWLIDNRYTRTDKLAIQGHSNGGLLVGAVMTQHPEMFGACLPGVGVMDMLRFHQFTEGRQWVDDYGSADNPEEFKALLAYSPYHNIKPGTRYPATLISTADTDDRVVPGHSFKFAAELQRDQAGDAPVLIRISTRAGHGMGKPTAKRIQEAADEWAFLVKNLHMTIRAKAATIRPVQGNALGTR